MFLRRKLTDKKYKRRYFYKIALQIISRAQMYEPIHEISIADLIDQKHPHIPEDEVVRLIEGVIHKLIGKNGEIDEKLRQNAMSKIGDGIIKSYLTNYEDIPCIYLPTSPESYSAEEIYIFSPDTTNYTPILKHHCCQSFLRTMNYIERINWRPIIYSLQFMVDDLRAICTKTINDYLTAEL